MFCKYTMENRERVARISKNNGIAVPDGEPDLLSWEMRVIAAAQKKLHFIHDALLLSLTPSSSVAWERLPASA